jgi:hypothetical protein
LDITPIGYPNQSMAWQKRPTQPKLKAVRADSADSSMKLSDDQNANWIAAHLMAMNGAMGEARRIEVHVFPVSGVVETVFIRGFDRDGQLLPNGAMADASPWCRRLDRYTDKLSR